MASYTELRNLFDESTLRNKMAVAVIIAANEVLSDPVNFPTTTADVTLQGQRKAWAAAAFADSGAIALTMLKAVLAVNAGLTTAQITGATDTAIQNNVNAVVDLLAETM